MEIAYLTSEYPAVSHTFIKREVTALRRRGVSVHTFSVRRGTQESATAPASADTDTTFTVLDQSIARFAGSHLRTFFRSPGRYLRTALFALHHRPPGLKALLLSFAYFAEAGVLADEIRRRSIQHLHTHFANAGATVGLLSARLAGTTWSFVVHGPSETDYPAGYLLGEKVIAADMVVCVSWFGHSQAMRLVDSNHWGKFRLVRCGLPFDALPQPVLEGRNPSMIICVGRLCADKAQAGLLKAFAKVRDRFPKAELVLVGDGPSRPELEELAQSLGIADATVFRGRLPEQETLAEISRAGMMVLPSFWEGLPVALMEAMALGIPVITSRIAGVPELVHDGDNGLLFAPANWSELAAAMAKLLDDPALGSRLASAARIAVERQHDIQQSASFLDGYFSELVTTGEVRELVP
jgi:colanic acid/amylovoran biosynthesis glycosyltransferase